MTEQFLYTFYIFPVCITICLLTGFCLGVLWSRKND